MIYKVVIEKVQFVEADDAEEAEEKALDEDYLLLEESFVSINKATKKEYEELLHS